MILSAEERTAILSLARNALEAFLTGQPKPQIDHSVDILSEQCGCFVTLTNAGMLRGCIGTFAPRGPLGETIIDMAGSAAEDPRFVGNPITFGELPHIRVEVSILSPLERIDQPVDEKIEIGKHGIYIVSGFQSGCFLPEVAPEQGWGVEEFLDYCCTHKAGLPKGAWAHEDTVVYRFTSDKFSE